MWIIISKSYKNYKIISSNRNSILRTKQTIIIIRKKNNTPINEVQAVQIYKTIAICTA